MLDKILNSKKIIHKVLEATVVRNKVIAQNIANIDTPGYKRKSVSFEENLREAIENSSFQKNDIDKISIKITQDNRNISMRIDGNTVDIDTEMAELAKNAIKYNALIGLAGYSKILTVIKEGK